jgi:hypothetical protein
MIISRQEVKNAINYNSLTLLCWVALPLTQSTIVINYQLLGGHCPPYKSINSHHVFWQFLQVVHIDVVML